MPAPVPPMSDEHVKTMTAMYRAVIDSADYIESRYSAAGLDDISAGESFLLGILARHDRAGALRLLDGLGFAERDVVALTDGLGRRGYLRTRAAAPGRSRPAAVLTKRGMAAVNLSEYALRAASWADFPLREGDIIVSTPVKCGTTWTQMICALLVFQTPDLPGSLPDLSPWLDAEPVARRETAAALAAQTHRRFIKTHLPLSELPADDRVTYVVVGRHLLDAAISYYHHRINAAEHHERPASANRRGSSSPRNWLLQWIATDTDLHANRGHLLPDMLGHLSEAWARRADPSVVLLHYEDLSADLEGEMRNLAARLRISVPEHAWPALVKAATFSEMRSAAGRLQPEDGLGGAPEKFFRKGTSGSGRSLLSSAELAYYHARAAQLAPPDCLAWLHREGRSSDEGAARPR